MNNPLLLKGFEVELYTGRADGTVVGCSAEAAAALEGFVTEPDHRNLEYITPPDASYARQLQLLLEPRQRLRHWLASRQLTLLPGSTLSLGGSRRFERSDPNNPYHGYIEATYGTKVVTASVHINLGLTSGQGPEQTGLGPEQTGLGPEQMGLGPEQMDSLFAGLRLMRCEAALLLALSASSPFLDGAATGAHSQRWLQFPLTPAEVPLFVDHQHYIRWMGQQLELGTMQNVRHLWTSVRPNGDNRPHDLNRLEIRICDLVTDPLVLLAITAFAELRLQQLLRVPERYDPIQASRLSPTELAKLADANDRAAARSSLDASLNHWRDGAPVIARHWLRDQLAELAPLANELGLSAVVAPLQNVLDHGNQAMRWLAGHQSGIPITTLLGQEIAAMAEQEATLLEANGTDGRPGPLG